MGSRELAEEIVRTVLLDAGCDFMAEDSVKFVAAKIADKDATIARLEAENAGLRVRAEDSRLVVLYNGPASGCATVSGDWARRTFGPDRCAQITIEAIGNRLTVKPHTANGGGGGQ